MPSFPIVRKTGNELLDLFQRTLVDFLKETLVVFTRGKAGLVPPSGGSDGRIRFLCEDGEWREP